MNPNMQPNLRLPTVNTKGKQKPRYWNEEEDALLREAIVKHGSEGYHTWKEVAKHIPNRTYRECMQRWTKVLAPGLKKGKWSSEEDEALMVLVTQQLETLGETNGKRIVWNKVAQGFDGRSCKQCRERWINHLDPSVKKTEWTQEEDLILMRLFDSLPNKWAKIARQIPGRTENMVKVRWNALNRQAKKRKQSGMYYPPAPYMSFPPLPQGNGNPQSYNQFYINNSFSLSLNNQNQNPHQAVKNSNGASQQSGASAQGPQKKMSEAEKQKMKMEEFHQQQLDFRKNSLYLFPNGEWSGMHLPNFPNVPNLPPMQGFHPRDQELMQSREEHMRKMSLALSNLQQAQNMGMALTPPSQSNAQTSKNGSKKKNGPPGERKDSLMDTMHTLPRTASLAQLQKMNLLAKDNDRRLSFGLQGFNFEDQADDVGGRRLSSFLYQDLVKNINQSQVQNVASNSNEGAKRQRVDGSNGAEAARN